MNKSLRVLQERTFIRQCTDFEALSELMDREPVRFYLGVDPTGRSIHIGHMVPFFAMHHLQEGGHEPVALVGDGTAMIGDPSGKTEMRKMLSLEEIRQNSASLRDQLGTVVNFDENPPPGTGRAIMLNNYSWLGELNYIDFLRDIGRHFSVNRMLTFESYRQRLERGLSFVEFNYQLLQSYDYYVLNRDHRCRLQIGGDDQWGNIVAGIELIRKMGGSESYGLTFNLITRSDGQKMGKSEKGAVFIDAELFSPYDFFQYWRNVNDEDVIRFMKLFTFLPLEEISEYDGSDINAAKERLAYEQTKIIHGQEEADQALEAAKALFTLGTVDLEALNLPSMEIPRQRLEEGIGVLELFAMTELCATNSDARRLVVQGGATINERKITDPKEVIDSTWLEEDVLLLRAGKKRYYKIVVA